MTRMHDRDNHAHIIGISDEHRDWVRYPGLMERQKVDERFQGMEETLYQQLYACHLCVAIAKLREVFLARNPELISQEVVLARVPRGGVFSTELLEGLLMDHRPHMLNLEKSSINQLRRARKQLQQNPYSEEFQVEYRKIADQLVQSASVPRSESETHLVLPEDIADSGNTLLLIIDAYFRKLLAHGQTNLRVSILVPTASIDSLHDQTGILTRASYLESVLSEEFGCACSLHVQLFTLYEEDDAEYLAELRQEKHDHGTTHEAVRNHPVFPRLKQTVLEYFPEDGQLDEDSQQLMLNALFQVVQGDGAVA